MCHGNRSIIILSWSLWRLESLCANDVKSPSVCQHSTESVCTSPCSVPQATDLTVGPAGNTALISNKALQRLILLSSGWLISVVGSFMWNKQQISFTGMTHMWNLLLITGCKDKSRVRFRKKKTMDTIATIENSVIFWKCLSLMGNGFGLLDPSAVNNGNYLSHFRLTLALCSNYYSSRQVYNEVCQPQLYSGSHHLHVGL